MYKKAILCLAFSLSASCAFAHCCDCNFYGLNSPYPNYRIMPYHAHYAPINSFLNLNISNGHHQRYNIRRSAIMPHKRGHRGFGLYISI